MRKQNLWERRAVKAAVLMASIVTASVAPAIASSDTGIVEYGYEECFNGNTVPTTTQLETIALGLVGLYNLDCENAVIASAMLNAGHDVRTAEGLPGMAQGAVDSAPAEDAIAMVGVAVGQAVAQAPTIGGLGGVEAAWGVSDEGTIWAAPLNTERDFAGDVQSYEDWAAYFVNNWDYCLWIPTPCSIPGTMVTSAMGTATNAGDPREGIPGDGVSKFQWESDVEIAWNPRSGKLAVDGLAWSNMYYAETQPNPAWRFWATSHVNSVTPINGWRLLKVLSSVVPDEEVQRVTASPLGTKREGQAGSWEINVTLNGEAKFRQHGGGASFGLSRSWPIPEGTVSGGMLHNREHYAVWQAGNRAGTSHARSSEGAETWKVPSDELFGYSFFAEYAASKPRCC